MIAVDTNILAYAHREDSPFHGAAFERVAELAEGRAAWSIPWPCVHEFVAVVTHPRIYAPPTPLALALDQVDAWLESPTLVLLAESAEHWSILRELLSSAHIGGAQVHDARVAAVPTARRAEVVVGGSRLYSLRRPHGREPFGEAEMTRSERADRLFT